MATKKDIESLKVWLLGSLLGMTGALLAIAASIVFYALRVVGNA